MNLLSRRVLLLLGALLGINIVVWVASVVAWMPWLTNALPILLLAYVLGLRHAFDADHIAAIDNVVRKLVAAGEKPIFVGFFFATGHSTVVFIATVAICLAVNAVSEQFDNYRKISGLIGASVSGAFLLLIAMVNIFVLTLIIKTLRDIRSGVVHSSVQLDGALDSGGILSRYILKPAFKSIDRSWKMYPLGLLFGLGFDTATEVTLLGISAVQAQNGMPIWLIIFLPLLFASGMALLDTLDGILMLGAYSWAIVNPLRKVYYNLIITSLSVFIALTVGFIQVLSVIHDAIYPGAKGDEPQTPEPAFWQFIGAIQDRFDVVGGVIAGTFVLAWGISTAVYFGFGFHHYEGAFGGPIESDVQPSAETSGSHHASVQELQDEKSPRGADDNEMNHPS
ncbi:high-affinity nickel-transport protein-domain-containing protein [Cladochytrium replicatum]|nr:high-affinity nickel-transport protein-domain-containing protein [Cladochytrium replicatum]